MALNVTAGANEMIYGTLGLPVDAMRGAINLGIQGVNAVAGTEIDELPDDSFMGSKWISGGAGALYPVLDPANTQAVTLGDKIARGVGQGIGATVAPEAAAGLLAKVPSLASAAGKMMGVTGRSATMGQAATNAAIGGVSGAGSTYAMEAVPEPYKPLAGVVGGLVAGVPAALAPAAVLGTVSVAKDAIAPLTAGGREALAGQRLVTAAKSSRLAQDRFANDPREILPGSEPTTFQLTGDLGLGGLERGIEAKFPERFAQRRADQNAARVDALGGVQPDGSPEAVTAALRARLSAIDDETQTAVNEATRAARRPAAAIGTGTSPAASGDTMRSALETARAAAKDQERALWSAVDPDGVLALPAGNVRLEVSRLRRELPTSAKPPSGEEAAIFDVVAGYRNVVPFNEVTALQSRLKSEMRTERMTNGETPAYRRMSLVNMAVERDLEMAVAKKAEQEAADVAAGSLQPDQTLAARIAAVNAPNVGDAVFTPGGRRLGVKYEIAEAGSLEASHTADGRVNQAYPSGLQPRDRSRAASETQIANISRNLQPERLGASTSAAEGAPIVGPDGVVESGNGRVLGIRGAYRQNGQSAKAYRDYLQSQGYDTEGFKEPVLVRRRTSEMSDLERYRFAQESNASSSLSMSASEQAATDASRLDRGVLDLYRGGDVSSAENRDFARAFLGKVPDKGQEGSFVTKDGTVSLDGAQRMRNALLQSAYRDSRLVASLADEGDENIRAFGRALSDISGDVARLRAGIDAGDIEAVADISAPLVEAAQIVQNARSKGIKLADAVAQQDAFSRMSEGAMSILRLAYGESLSGRLSRENLTDVMRVAVADAEKQSAQARLFGEALGADQILGGIEARYAKVAGQGRVSRGASHSASGGEGGPSARQSGPVSPGPRYGEGIRGSDESATGSRSDRVLERPELAANFDDAALGRLNAARGSTKARVETFDNRTLGPIRKRPGTTSPYDMPASTVPARIFMPGPKSAEAIGQFRAAVGDDQALPALRDYAVDRLRATALRDDGTLDPARLSIWRKQHADALRSLPELDAQLSNAGRASQAMVDVARERKTRLDEFQAGKIGSLLKVDDPADVSRTVGGIFGRNDAVNEMLRLRSAIGKDQDAQQGLRKAVVDHVMDRFVGNAEVAASGRAGIKSDGFQTFVKTSKNALRAAGFGADEIETMQAIADDLQRANRSIVGVKIPGGSNTTQDLISASRGVSLLGRILSTGSSAAGAGAGAYFGGPLYAAIGVIGAQTLTNIRRAGIETVDDLLADALLNPGRAKMLMMKAPDKPDVGAWQLISQAYGRAARTALAIGADKAGEVDKPGSTTGMPRQSLEITVGRTREMGVSR